MYGLPALAAIWRSCTVKSLAESYRSENRGPRPLTAGSRGAACSLGRRPGVCVGSPPSSCVLISQPPHLGNGGRECLQPAAHLRGSESSPVQCAWCGGWPRESRHPAGSRGAPALTHHPGVVVVGQRALTEGHQQPEGLLLTAIEQKHGRDDVHGLWAQRRQGEAHGAGLPSKTAPCPQGACMASLSKQVPQRQTIPPNSRPFAKRPFAGNQFDKNHQPDPSRWASGHLESREGGYEHVALLQSGFWCWRCDRGPGRWEREPHATATRLQ